MNKSKLNWCWQQIRTPAGSCRGVGSQHSDSGHWEYPRTAWLLHHCRHGLGLPQCHQENEEKLSHCLLSVAPGTQLIRRLSFWSPRRSPVLPRGAKPAHSLPCPAYHLPLVTKGWTHRSPACVPLLFPNCLPGFQANVSPLLPSLHTRDAVLLPSLCPPLLSYPQKLGTGFCVGAPVELAACLTCLHIHLLSLGWSVFSLLSQKLAEAGMLSFICSYTAPSSARRPSRILGSKFRITQWLPAPIWEK